MKQTATGGNQHDVTLLSCVGSCSSPVGNESDATVYVPSERVEQRHHGRIERHRCHTERDVLTPQVYQITE